MSMRPLEYSQAALRPQPVPPATWSPSQDQKALLQRFIAAEAMLRPKPVEEAPQKPRQNAALERFLNRNMGSVKKMIN